MEESIIDSAEELKALPEAKLPELAETIRQALIRSISVTGGHLGPNLGVVELTIALHRVFDTPKDKFIFDVSHQGYVHKMLTGRWKDIHTIRQTEGLNGFLLRTESEHDCYGAGHAGTAVSASLGFAVGRDLRGSDEHVVCVAGDAAFTCGVSYEGLNNIATQTKRLIIVLNDNEWSIDRNVGAIASYFNKLTTNPAFANMREKMAQLVERIAGKKARNFVHRVEESAKNLLWPSVIFEELGLRYYGPVDGHDVFGLIRMLEFMKTRDEPVLLHILTEKGRGYAPALRDPGKFHGLGKYKVETGETPCSASTYSAVFARTLTDFAKKDDKITAITAAMPGGTGLAVFKEEIPERYFDVGIAEEHAALFACGLAAQGLKPFLTIYSTFMQRAYDMILHDIALQNLPVRLCMDRAGLSGDDGPTHHGLFDIGYLRQVPNLVFMQPRDEKTFVDMLWTMANHDSGPIAVRYPRGTGTGATPSAEPSLLPLGVGEVVEDGSDVALIGLGSLFPMAAQVREALEADGVSTALIDPRFIKPLDRELLIRYAKKVKVIATFEDHVLTNGFGLSVIELLSDEGIDVPVVRIGWPDEFIEHGAVDWLRAKHNITVESALERVRRHLAQPVANG